jgi:hypothetical protein
MRNAWLSISLFAVALAIVFHAAREDEAREHPAKEGGDKNLEFDGFAIVESEEYIACVSTSAHWSGMEIVFVRRRTTDGEDWLADGIAVENVASTDAVIVGNALYTEYEKDNEHTVVRKPYRFRLDFVKGALDIWTSEHHGKEAGEGKSFHFNGACEAYTPPLGS